MFGRKGKSKKAVPLLTLFDESGRAFLYCPLSDYVLPEESVLALSLEFFNDPEPCEIHRAAVHKRAMMELMAHCPAGSVRPVSEMAPSEQSYFPEGTAAIRMEEPV